MEIKKIKLSTDTETHFSFHLMLRLVNLDFHVIPTEFLQKFHEFKSFCASMLCFLSSVCKTLHFCLIIVLQHFFYHLILRTTYSLFHNFPHTIIYQTHSSQPIPSLQHLKLITSNNNKKKDILFHEDY